MTEEVENNKSKIKLIIPILIIIGIIIAGILAYRFAYYIPMQRSMINTKISDIAEQEHSTVADVQLDYMASPTTQSIVDSLKEDYDRLQTLKEQADKLKDSKYTTNKQKQEINDLLSNLDYSSKVASDFYNTDSKLINN